LIFTAYCDTKADNMVITSHVDIGVILIAWGCSSSIAPVQNVVVKTQDTHYIPYPLQAQHIDHSSYSRGVALSVTVLIAYVS
jgi:hypothetical protein